MRGYCKLNTSRNPPRLKWNDSNTEQSVPPTCKTNTYTCPLTHLLVMNIVLMNKPGITTAKEKHLYNLFQSRKLFTKSIVPCLYTLFFFFFTNRFHYRCYKHLILRTDGWVPLFKGEVSTRLLPNWLSSFYKPIPKREVLPSSLGLLHSASSHACPLDMLDREPKKL